MIFSHHYALCHIQIEIYWLYIHSDYSLEMSYCQYWGLASCLKLLVSYQDLQTREQTAVKIVGFAKDTNKSIRTGLLCIEQA